MNNARKCQMFVDGRHLHPWDYHLKGMKSAKSGQI